MKIGIPKEIGKGETRVAATPDVVTKILKLGYEVSVEKGAGKLAGLQGVQVTSARAKAHCLLQ